MAGDKPDALVELGHLRLRARELEEQLGLGAHGGSASLDERLAFEAYELVGRHGPDMISVHAANGDYLFASPSCERLFGWTPDQLVHRNAYSFFHDEDVPAVARDHVTHSSPGERPRSVRYRLRCADGSFCWVETRSRAHRSTAGAEQIVCFTRRLRRAEARAD